MLDMIKKQEEFSLPFDVISRKPYIGYELIQLSNGNEYLAIRLTKEAYASYLEQVRLSNHISRSVMEYPSENQRWLLFYYDQLTELTVRNRKILEILNEVFEKSSFEITLKKDHMVHLNHIYKVLDNKFSYFELRIREIEMNPIKNDISWIILSKYNVILDAKIYLYDLQTDIFKLIDQNTIIKYGFVPKKLYSEMYQKGYLLPFLELYYAPIGMLFSRYELSIGGISLDQIKKLDEFNQKYFCFMTLYILTLSLNMGTYLTNYSVNSYVLITKKIKSFIANYKAIMEGKL